MTKMNAKQAATFCKENSVKKDSWSCGYVLEAHLEVDHNIVLDSDSAWQELEDILFYNEGK